MRRFLLFILIFACNLFSQNITYTDQDKMIGYYTFNAELSKADSLLNKLIEENPDNPKYYALKTPFFFYSRYFGRGGVVFSDSLKDLIIKYGQKAITLAENNNESIENNFYAGLASGFISRVYASRREYTDAYFANSNSEGYFENVLAKDPGNVDALLGMAITEFFVENNLTGFTYAVAWSLGLSGDRQHAMDNIQLVAEKGKLFNHEAGFALAMINRFFYNNQELALSQLKELTQKFPDNAWLDNQYKQIEFANLIIDKGADHLVENFDKFKEQYIQNSGILNVLGYRMLNQNRIDDAIKIFQTNIKLYPDQANVYDSLAETYMTKGNNEMAIKYYRMAYDKLPDDTTISEEFRQQLKESIIENLKNLNAPIAI